MRKKNSFRHESLQDCQSVHKILSSLTKGFSKNSLKFSDEDDEIVLEPEGLLRLKLTADQEEVRNSVTLRISWETKGGLEKNKKLNISSK